MKNSSPPFRDHQNMPSIALKKLAFSLSSIKKGSTNLEQGRNHTYNTQSSESLDKRQSIHHESRNKGSQVPLLTQPDQPYISFESLKFKKADF